MAKVSLDSEKVTRFFAYHIEKIVLGVVILLLVVFVYLGYSLEGIEKTPKELETVAQAADEAIDQDTWPVVAPEYAPPTGHVARVQQSRVPTQDSFYALDKPFLPANTQQGEKREDPELFPPTNVEVYAVSGPIAVRQKPDEVDPLAELANSEFKKEEPKKKKKKRRSRGGYYGSEMMSGGGYEEEMESYESEMMSGYEGQMESPYGDEMEGYGIGATMPSVVQATGKKFPGYRPPGQQGVLAKAANIIAVKAVVEVQRQWDEYDRAFSNALGYNPARDQPKYLLYSAQRADVTDDPDAEPPESAWKPISNTNASVVQLQRSGWVGVAKEIVDQRYVSRELTMPLPPLMMRDLEPLALHSQTPRQQVGLPSQLAAKDEEQVEEEAASDEPISDIPGAIPKAGMAGPMGAPGAMGSYPGMSMPGMYGSGPGYGYGSEMESEMYSEEEYEMEYGSEEMMMSGEESGGYGYGYGMYGGGMGMSAPRGPKAEYLLVRFFDFTARPGRKYRYRVQVIMEDPNHPQNPALEPSSRALSDDVQARLKSIQESEKAEERRVFYLRTDWSEPSDVISLDPMIRTFAGKVEPGRAAQIPNLEDEVPVVEPKGNVMTVVWDPAYAIDVPVEKSVPRGAVLDFKETANAIHPVTLVYKKIEDFQFHTNRFVIDVKGGVPLPSSLEEEKDAPLTVPGEIVFFDEKGDIVVRNELDDVDTYSLYTPPDMSATPSYGMPGEMGEGYDEYMEGGYGEMESEY